jgi:phage-related protein
MSWAVMIVPEAVPELESLPADMRARFQRLVELIESRGLEHLREPYVKHLEGKLWEMRMSGRDGISRAIYVTASGRRAVVLRAFVKKSERTPARELEIARQRAKGIR